MQRIIAAIDSLSEFVSKWSSYLIFILVLLTVEQVFARYLFNDSSMAAQEWEWHLFALIFLFGSANAYRTNAHVRVDLFYSRMSESGRGWIDLFGTLVFLLPLCGLTVYYGYAFAKQSYLYMNPHPTDFLSNAWFGKESFLYLIFSPLEAWLRKFLLVGEVSANPGGLEARWLIKAVIPISFFFLALQALAEALRAIEKIRGKTND